MHKTAMIISELGTEDRHGGRLFEQLTVTHIAYLATIKINICACVRHISVQN